MGDEVTHCLKSLAKVSMLINHTGLTNA